MESRERSIEPELVVRAERRPKEVAGALAENSRKRAPYNGIDRIEPQQKVIEDADNWQSRGRLVMRKLK